MATFFALLALIGFTAVVSLLVTSCVYLIVSMINEL